MDTEPKEVNHIIGHARTIETTILVIAYLRERYRAGVGGVHPDMFTYRFHDPTPANGCWSSDIIVRNRNQNVPDVKFSGELVDVCRAFVAGRGEIWS